MRYDVFIYTDYDGSVKIARQPRKQKQGKK